MGATAIDAASAWVNLRVAFENLRHQGREVCGVDELIPAICKRGKALRAQHVDESGRQRR